MGVPPEWGQTTAVPSGRLLKTIKMMPYGYHNVAVIKGEENNFAVRLKHSTWSTYLRVSTPRIMRDCHCGVPKIQFCLRVTKCGLGKGVRCFKGPQCLHLQDQEWIHHYEWSSFTVGTVRHVDMHVILVPVFSYTQDAGSMILRIAC